jgi:membrane protein DedA with SNARE-associated domain
VVKYGPQILTVVADLARRHLILTLSILALIFGALGWWIWRKLRKRGSDSVPEAL